MICWFSLSQPDTAHNSSDLGELLRYLLLPLPGIEWFVYDHLPVSVAELIVGDAAPQWLRVELLRCWSGFKSVVEILNKDFLIPNPFQQGARWGRQMTPLAVGGKATMRALCQKAIFWRKYGVLWWCFWKNKQTRFPSGYCRRTCLWVESHEQHLRNFCFKSGRCFWDTMYSYYFWVLVLCANVNVIKWPSAKAICQFASAYMPCWKYAQVIVYSFYRKCTMPLSSVS